MSRAPDKVADISIRKITEAELPHVLSILIEAARWLKNEGKEMWSEDEFSVEAMLGSYRLEDMYLGWVGGSSAAAMIVMEDDPDFWPHAAPGESLFIHKLAVRKQYAKQGVSREMIAWAKLQAGMLGKKYVRLDCAADRTKLCEFYEGQGFIKTEERVMFERFPTAFYQYEAEGERANPISALIEIINEHSVLADIFDKAPLLELRHYYVGAGCIVQTVWNKLCGFPPHYGIKDVDLVYYDPDVSEAKEQQVIEQAAKLFAGIPFRIDVKNQARVHLWYERHFGYAIPPHESLESAINTWPTTATAVGVNKKADGSWTVYAPFGLNDLFGLIVRANKRQITKEIYDTKVSR